MIKNVRYVKVRNISDKKVHLSGKGDGYMIVPGDEWVFHDGYFLYKRFGRVEACTDSLEIVDIMYLNPQIKDHPVHIKKIETRFEILDL